MATSSTSVALVLGWDEAAEALPTAQALAPRTQVQLWLPQPLAADATLGAVAIEVLDGTGAAPRSRPAASRQAPAAPYLGASSPAGSSQPVRVPAAPYLGSGLPPTPSYAAPQPALTASPASLPAEAISLVGAAEAGTEPGIKEAAELSSDLPTRRHELPAGLPADDAEPARTTAETAELSTEQSELLAEQPVPSGMAASVFDMLPGNATDQLNYRIIQYARHAVRRALQMQFEVIVAVEWPTWLAAVEIRQQTRRTLVLRVGASSITEHSAAADRGWIAELERLALRHADVLLVPDDATAQRLTAQYHISAGRFRVLPPNATPDFTAALVLDAQLAGLG
ncbi:glycosyltransferase [Hymenobacter koreensis]|uniref:Glycosyltransferase subfamily 4-like N-terminal domain-containing protein n=1 Tax=Hymenobacter koreensis TaxID=1084523 RepID=A0ABP8IVL8_9BACT